MLKNLKEFKSDMEVLRKDMYHKGEVADPKLVASWVDRLAISLERISDTLDIMSEELDQLAALRVASSKKHTKTVRKTKSSSKKKNR